MQYLVSIYFDEKTDKKFREYIGRVADCCSNTFMMDHNVPPHITISAFETDKEDVLIKRLKEKAVTLRRGSLQWVSVGALPSGVLYVAPVLNTYLHGMAEGIYEAVKDIECVKMSKFYQPFQWLPHVTVGKKLTSQEMAEGFAALQSVFQRSEGDVVRIGLAAKNPYKEICNWELE